VDVGCLYVGQDLGVSVWAGCNSVRNSGVRIWLAVSRSGYEYLVKGCLYLGQDMGVSVWVGCIEARMWV
jgi:hypothetical protein